MTAARVRRWRALLPLSTFRSYAVGLAVVVAGVVMVRALNEIYPVKDWLLWNLACIWGWQGLLGAAFASCGHLLLTRVIQIKPESGLEMLALAVPAGAVVFAAGMFMAGYLSLYGATFAVLWPLAMLAAGLPAARPALVRLAARLGQPAPRLGPIAVAASAFGGFAVVIAYLGILSPDSLTYDAAWTHVVIAQDYAREGRIVPFWGDWPKNLPHLSSVFSTWGFLVPGLGAPPLRWMMALHTEFAFFLWTLVGVSAAIRWMVGRPVSAAWVALFLFPGIFVFDSNLGGGADHVLAFFAAPMFLAAMGTTRTMRVGWWALLGILFAGALLTKFQAAYLLLPMAIVVAIAFVRALCRTVASRSGAAALIRLLSGPAVAIACVVALTAPHFLKNWIYYHNPVYPLAQRVFTASRPTFPDAPLLVDNVLHHFGSHPSAELFTRVKSALKLLFTFSIRRHETSNAHCQCVGMLFTFSLPLVLLLPRARRIRIGALVALGALFTWAMTYLVVRNIQTFLPLLAAVTGAVLVRAWEVGRVARVGVVTLVAIQIAWSGDLMFGGHTQLQSAIALIRGGIEGKAPTRFANYRRDFVELGRTLPKHALVLLHNDHMHLGIDRRVVIDALGFQGLIDDRTFRTPRQLYDRLRTLGVTHVVYHFKWPAPSKQSEVIFSAFIARYGEGSKTFGNLRLMAMPAQPPAEEAPYQALVVGVGGYPDGLYRVEDLGTWEHMPPNLQRRSPPLAPLQQQSGPVPLLAQAQVALLGGAAASDATMKDIVARDFKIFAEYPGLAVHIRPR